MCTNTKGCATKIFQNMLSEFIFSVSVRLMKKKKKKNNRYVITIGIEFNLKEVSVFRIIPRCVCRDIKITE